ncbi:MAG: GntR family transcriptional regulator [Lachnospiraceae bacterium]|nr:GntR family transcriptional regulator [Lachnospiraceae bacterium]
MGIKYRTLAESLKKEITNRGPLGSQKLPTEAELARTYGVSRQTVRQALSLLLHEGLIEKRQGSGTYIAPGVFPSALSSHEIAILVPDVSGYPSQHSIAEAETILNEAGYMTAVYSTQNRTSQERNILLDLLKRSVRGLLVRSVRTAFSNPNISLYQELRARGAAVIFLGEAYPELTGGIETNLKMPSLHESTRQTTEPQEKSYQAQSLHEKKYQAAKLQEDSYQAPGLHEKSRQIRNRANSTGLLPVLQVTSDDFAGGELLSRHLIGLGHKKIAGIFRLDNQSGHRQYAGVLHAICESGLTFDDRDFLWYDPLTARMPDDKILLSFIRIQLAGCTAVICQDEAIAAALIRELQRLEMPVPQRFSVAAFSSGREDLSPVRITCAVRPGQNPWILATELLLAEMAGKAVSSVSCPWTLHIGESTGAAN